MSTPYQQPKPETTPSPARFFQVINAYQQTAALKAAIELELFTAIGAGPANAKELAQKIHASERGTRALCDYLVVLGFVTKTEGRYGLTKDSALFLDKKSPAYLGSAVRFLAAPDLTKTYNDLASVIRDGHPAKGHSLHDPDHPIWTDFARGMAPLIHLVAEGVERLVHSDSPIKVLDITASHGLFGITIARKNPNAKIVAVDWSSVLTVARENAERAGVSNRLTTLAGDAFKISFGSDFDVALVPNCLHMWDPATIHQMLQKVHGALKPKGRVVIVELVPNEDRVSPPIPAAFAITMLANTNGGDAYTASEYKQMLEKAGFTGFGEVSLPPTEHTAILSVKL